MIQLISRSWIFANRSISILHFDPKRILRLVLPVIAYSIFGFAHAITIPPERLTIVTDINFPPYLLQDQDGKLQGILREKWELWSEKTGIPVQLKGMEWKQAQESVLRGTADVIETLAYTDARSRLYEYSQPYSPIEANVYFHRSITGINNVASLRGFKVAAKSGSACAHWLTERGIDVAQTYTSSETLINAAREGNVRIFCMDAPAAQYFLFKLNLADEFRHTTPLYTTQFHWAVAKGQTGLRDFIQQGFDRFAPQDLETINNRWLGSPIRFPIDYRYLSHAIAAALAIVGVALLMVLWNRMLRRQVAAKTAALITAQKQTQADAVKLSQVNAQLRLVANSVPVMLAHWSSDMRCHWANARYAGYFGLTPDTIAGFSIVDLRGQEDFEQIRPYLERVLAGESVSYETSPLRQDGVRRTLSVILVPERDENSLVKGWFAVLHDVTEQRLAEEALRDSNERFSKLFHDSPAAQSLTHADTRIYLDVNRAWCQLHSRIREKTIGQHVDDVTPLDPQEAAQIRAAIKRDGHVDNFEATVRRHDGSERICLVSGHLIGMEDGQYYHWWSIDVTEQRAAQIAARQADERLRIAIEHLNESFVLWDPDDRLVLHNRKFREVTVTPEKLVPGMLAEDLLRAEAWSGRIASAAGREEDWVTERMASRRAGRQPYEMQRGERWYIVNTQRLPDGCYVSCHMDITERKHAEEALRASEQQLLSMFHESPAAQSVIEGTGNGHYVDVNRSWCELTGFERTDAVGKKPMELGLRNLADSTRLVALMERDGHVDRQPGTIRRRNGEFRQCQVSARRLMAKDRQLTLWWMIDVTEQQKAQTQIEQLNTSLEQTVLQRTAELTGTLQRLRAMQDSLVQSEKLAALGRLVAGLAHELNTPIGNSLLSASTLAERTDAFARDATGNLRRSILESYVAEAREGTAILMRNLERANSLISSFKQVAADQSSDQRRSFQLKEVIDEVLLTHRPVLKKTPITISVKVPPDIRLDSYPGPLGQVIGNLLVNAVSHGYEGRNHGTVLIQASRQEQDGLEVSVRDDGCGIPEDHLRRVFDPFFTTKMGRGGTGLGLSICHNLVTQTLGGRLEVQSRAGSGTTFTITLPAVAPLAKHGIA